jgi:hypothetical protein
VPAAAVIPAPIAYIKVVAVKKLVVEFLPRPWACLVPSRKSRRGWPSWARNSSWAAPRASLYAGAPTTSFTVKKLECSKQAFRT